MKMGLIVVLIIAGIYMLAFHYAPFPLSHESFGLFNHTIHRIAGVVLLVAAGLVWWFSRTKQAKPE
jgi:hypothetical protein